MVDTFENRVNQFVQDDRSQDFIRRTYRNRPADQDIHADFGLGMCAQQDQTYYDENLDFSYPMHTLAENSLALGIKQHSLDKMVPNDSPGSDSNDSESQDDVSQEKSPTNG